MGFQQGLSGLNAAARNLDVIGNNVANTNTVGFKSSRAEFADAYAASPRREFNPIAPPVSTSTTRTGRPSAMNSGRTRFR